MNEITKFVINCKVIDIFTVIREAILFNIKMTFKMQTF